MNAVGLVIWAALGEQLKSLITFNITKLDATYDAPRFLIGMPVESPLCRNFGYSNPDSFEVAIRPLNIYILKLSWYVGYS
jgi:hypothetical protein